LLNPKQLSNAGVTVDLPLIFLIIPYEFFIPALVFAEVIPELD
jgi:hypothetical protein